MCGFFSADVEDLVSPVVAPSNRIVVSDILKECTTSVFKAERVCGL
jgi:hypothetical protein